MNFPIVGWIVIAVAALSVVAVLYFVVKEGDHHEDYYDPDSAPSGQQSNPPDTSS
jgi:hypothetical protein